MKRDCRPVRKCHNCGLNLGDRCAVYPVPREKWHHGLCPGYNNEEMVRQYEAEQARHPTDRRKQLRCEAARRRASEPHHQGTLPFGKR